jgi:FKBP-type peptidyl-prolyl cis-trans isomerase
MKFTELTIISVAAASLLFSACTTPGDRASADLSSRIDSVSYSIGYLQGSGMMEQGINDLDLNNFVAGFEKAINEEDALMERMDMQMLIQQYLSDVQMRQEVERLEQAEVNREEGLAFLEENAQREDVMVTESGLQYRVIEEGSGVSPTAEDEVEVHYRGRLISGEEFDSSYDRGETAEFILNAVIPGWTEGVQLMSEGATYEFFIPAELGYGDNPPPGSIITPGSVLIFEVELIDVKE